MIPININNGIANSVVFVIIPKIRFGNPVKNDCSKVPVIIPINAKINDVPANEKATGKPSKRTTIIVKNNISAIHSIIYCFKAKVVLIKIDID